MKICRYVCALSMKRLDCVHLHQRLPKFILLLIFILNCRNCANFLSIIFVFLPIFFPFATCGRFFGLLLKSAHLQTVAKFNAHFSLCTHQTSVHTSKWILFIKISICIRTYKLYMLCMSVFRNCVQMRENNNYTFLF